MISLVFLNPRLAVLKLGCTSSQQLVASVGLLRTSGKRLRQCLPPCRELPQYVIWLSAEMMDPRGQPCGDVTDPRLEEAGTGNSSSSCLTELPFLYWAWRAFPALCVPANAVYCRFSGCQRNLQGGSGFS